MQLVLEMDVCIEFGDLSIVLHENKLEIGDFLIVLHENRLEIGDLSIVLHKSRKLLYCILGYFECFV